MLTTHIGCHLFAAVLKHFAPSNPFFSVMLQQFIALSQEEKGSQAVGRIVAAINERLITPERECRSGRF